MKITVVGVLVVIGTIVMLGFVADHIMQNLNRKQNGNDEQPINPS
jgi:hypothetical protein